MSSNFQILKELKISNTQTIVISKNLENDSLSIGRKMQVVDEEMKNINFFLKGTLRIPKDKLIDFKEVLTEAIELYSLNIK